VASDAGWKATGYERSAWAAEYGRENLGVDIVLGDGRDAGTFDGRYEVITMWDVLEHLEHPRELLTHMHQWLEPGGVLVVSTVNKSALGARIAKEHWRHFAPPHHLQYFSRASLQRLLSDCGFQLASMRNTGVMMSADSRRRELRGVARLAEHFATHWRAARLATVLNLLDEVEVMAIRQ
jgi:cyclopropane fatty-acyl-phospholipid synthase-like methyltransferase